MKQIKEMVWPVGGYTDKIHFAVKYTFEASPQLPFSIKQVIDKIRNGYTWLTLDTNQKSIILHKIVKTAITQLIQKGFIKQVYHPTQTEPQWMLAGSVSDSPYKSLTDDSEVAKTPAAVKAIRQRSIGADRLRRLNRAGVTSL